jgi:large-conductance mechanosensitive channel
MIEFIAIGFLFLFIVLSHRALSKKINTKFERQNQRLAAAHKRELKLLKAVQQLSKNLGEKIIW